MAYEHLEVHETDHVVTIAMSNPPRHTMTAAIVGELEHAVRAVEDDPSVRVLVLTGKGDGVFIAHYEVNELADAAERRVSRGEGRDHPAGSRQRQLHPFNRVMRRLERMAAITIAAVNGNAAGGGCELALACDFRLMADGGYRFGLPETTVGIIPGAGGTQRLARLLGTARALDLILHGTRLLPDEALALGLLHRVVPADRFTDEVAAFAADLADRAPIALAAAKQAIREGVELSLDDGLLLEQDLFGRCMGTKDAAGAMRAALRGEPYEFAGE